MANLHQTKSISSCDPGSDLKLPSYYKLACRRCHSPDTMSASSPMSAKAEEAELLRRLSRQLEKRATDGISDDGVLKVTTRPTLAGYSTSVLAASAAAKAVAKACVAVNISTVPTDDDAHSVFDELLEECRLKYTKLTKQMVLAKIEALAPVTVPTDEDEDDGTKLRKSLEIVDEEMEKYDERVNSMKITRAMENTGESGNAKKRTYPISAVKPTKRRKRKNDPDEQRLIRAITDKYAQIRLTKHYTSKAEWSKIVEDTKKEMNMEGWSLAYDLLKKRVTWYYLSHPLKKQAVRLNHRKKEDKDAIDRLYAKYCKAKEAANHDLLPDGMVEKLANEELADSPDEAGTSMITVYKYRVQARFIKEHPELFSAIKMDEDKNKWTKAQRERFKLLADEVAKRINELKAPPTNMAPDKGLVDDLVESTKMEWDMMQFPLKASTTNRQKSPQSPRREKKKTGEKKKKPKAVAPNLHDISIDNDMINVINDRLAKGLSVTRQQGIEIAQSILVVRNITTFPKLNQTWWKAFLARNSDVISREGSDATSCIDSEMLEKVNELLAGGTAVTRQKGLDLARSICEERGIMSSVGASLDASWWKGFLARNRDKLQCA